MLHTILVTALALADTPAKSLAATPGESWGACVQRDAPTAIAGCSAIIRSGERRAAWLAIAHYNRANAYFRKAQFDRANLPNPRRATDSLTRAIRDFTIAIRLDPQLAEAWVNRGVAWYDKGDFSRAVSDATEAIRLRPDLAEARNNRSLAYHKLGRYDLAVRDFDETIRLKQNYGNALINRAMPSLEPPAAR